MQPNSFSFRKWIYRWHYRVGLLAAVFVLIVATTGLLLNHSESLGLQQHDIKSRWVLSLYGRSSASPFVHYKLGESWYSLDESYRLYINGVSTAASISKVRAIFLIDSATLLLAESQFALIDARGQLVEFGDFLAQGFNSLDAVRKDANGLVLLTDAGVLACDLDWAFCQSTHEKPTAWDAEPSPDIPPESITLAIRKERFGEGVPFARLLLDMHSGRLFGLSGKLIADLVALALCFLCISGVWNWWRSKR